MNTAGTLQIKSTSSEQTEAVAERIGRNLRGGETIELVSDVGGGKTTFARGLARGAGSNDTVGSPTFTISREYISPRFTICHYDFYRLTEAGIVAAELAESMHDTRTVTVIEWGDIVHDVLPKKRLSITIAQTAENVRQLSFTCPQEHSYLLTGLNI